ncbi:urea ABC transporter permease subunit UrtB [Elioraea rosea]|uniref:urea ABC transporter permease subunit UrtB n=1 Tax=Elioraea rosea TaxID=2492390 RepID=UPI0011829095|nr:urea ABC transporter permease subunit UrtB [Elioraea rosea]
MVARWGTAGHSPGVPSLCTAGRAVRRIVATLAILLGLAAPAAAQGGVQGEAIRALATTNFDELARAVERLALSGEPNALGIVEALRDGTLLFRQADRAVFWRDAQGRMRDAATGEVAEGVAPAALRPLRVNNRVRRAIDATIGALSLSNPDPRVRLAAAERVFRSRDPDAIPALDAQLARETEARVRHAMEAARAAAVLGSAMADDAKLAAVALIARRGDLEARNLLAGLAGVSEAVAQAAAAGVAAIDRRQAMLRIVQDIYYGISLGSVLLLAAIGLAVTFGTMGVINMAHGEMVMLGAYTTFVVQEAMRRNAPWLLDWSLAFAVPLAFLVSALAGALVERLIIRFLYGRPLETLLATFGLSLVLQQAVRTIFGPNNREVGNPSWMSGAFELGGVLVTWNRLWIIVFSMIVLFGLMLVLRRTAFGLAMRAVTQNRRMAGSMGIRTPWVDCMTFALGSGVAGLAGVALSQIDNVSPNLGQSYIIDSFMVVVFGGVGNLWGTLVAAMTLGIVNKLLEPIAGAVLGKIVVLLLLVLFIQRKPRGLFPLKGRAVES